MRPMLRLLLPLMCVLLPTTARATVLASGPGGFVLREEASFPGTPEAAWARLVQPARWWSADHTYSGDAANLTLALSPGGCWCETLPGGGFVRHMEVLFASPAKLLRLSGGLGPLQAMGAAGVLSFTLKADGPAATRIVVEYAVSGYAADGFEKLAVGVDQVLAAQVQRLATP